MRLAEKPAPQRAPQRPAGQPAWNNGIAVRFRPKRYTSRALAELAEEFGWMLVGEAPDLANFGICCSRTST
jgi:hypothetical protein